MLRIRISDWSIPPTSRPGGSPLAMLMLLLLLKRQRIKMFQFGTQEVEEDIKCGLTTNKCWARAPCEYYKLANQRRDMDHYRPEMNYSRPPRGLCNQAA